MLFFLKDNKKEFILWLNVPKVTAYKQKEQKTESDCKIANLQAQVDKLTGELQARRRKMHGKNNDRISSGDSLT